MRKWASLLLFGPIVAGAWFFARPDEADVLSSIEPMPLEADPILIGEVSSLTGSEAEFGISSRNGVELAVIEANANGGVKGRRLSLRVYDDQSIPERAARATTRLAKLDQVRLIIGEATSASSLAMAPMAQAAQLPMVTPASTNPTVTEQRDYVFRACFIDSFQGLAMAKYARQELDLRQIAMLVESESVYSEGLGEEFARRFAELGGAVVATASYRKGDTDFRAQLTAIAQQDVRALYIPGYVREVVAIAQQARQLGLKARLLGGDAWDSEKLFETGGAWLEGAVVTSHYSADAPSAQAFVRAYQEAFGSVPDARAALSYDAARLAMDAMVRAPDLSGPSLRAALAQTRDFPAVTGKLNLDRERNAVKPVVLLTVQNGRFSFIKTELP